MSLFEGIVIFALVALMVGAFDIVRMLGKIHETLIERLPESKDDEDNGLERIGP